MTTRSQMSSATLGFSVTSIFAELKHIFVEGPADLISRCAEDPMVALGYFLLFGWVVLRRHHRRVSPVSALTAYRTTTYQDEDIMDRSKESQSRPGSVQRNRIARTQEDAESTIPTGRLSPSLFPKEDRMDLSKQLQSRQESEHNKKLACKREDAENNILLDKMPEELLESSEEDRMDLSKQLQSRRESEHNKKLACKREVEANFDAAEPCELLCTFLYEDEMVIKRKWKNSENTILLDKMSEELLESSDSEYTILLQVDKMSEELLVSSGLECGLELGDNRNYAKEEKRFHLADLINAADDKPVVWAPPLPPPPPDPPNPN